MNYTIIFDSPYYILCEIHTWWIFTWNKEIVRSPFLEEMETVYKNLIKYDEI